MTNATKLALEESLKHLLLKKPLDKITINDLTTDCGISLFTIISKISMILWSGAVWKMPELPFRAKKPLPHGMKGFCRSLMP